MQVVDTASNSNLGSGQLHFPSSFPCAQVPDGKGAGSWPENTLPSPWSSCVFFLLGQAFLWDPQAELVTEPGHVYLEYHPGCHNAQGPG